MMENSKYQIFKQLHENPQPLLLPNAWDAGSAKVFEESGFEAIATSSSAVAGALGHKDGEQISFDDLLFVVRRICRSTTLPISVDFEGGYSRDAAQICEHLEALAGAGVVGINFEDSIVEGKRKLSEAKAVAEAIERIKNFCDRQKIEMFLNLRTDTYLLGVENRFERTLERIEIYESAGADGVFIPGLTNVAEMEQICRKTSLPVNVMCLPDLPTFEELAAAGVRRISMGPFMYEHLAKKQAAVIEQVRRERNFKSLFEEEKSRAV